MTADEKLAQSTTSKTSKEQNPRAESAEEGANLLWRNEILSDAQNLFRNDILGKAAGRAIYGLESSTENLRRGVVLPHTRGRY